MSKNDIAKAETETLEQLGRIKQALIALNNMPERAVYKQICEQYNAQLRALTVEQHQQKAQRDQQRMYYRKTLSGQALESALQRLNQKSQQQGRVRQRLKQERDQAIAPLTQSIKQADREMRSLKKQYHSLSQTWQKHIQALYQKEQANNAPNLSIVYQDQHLIVVNKPAGLLSVPGRRHNLQDSVLSRLSSQRPAGEFLQTVHRLDQATSGLIVLATSAIVHATLSQQFATRQVHKRYQAILSQPVTKACGTIDLPIWNNLECRPKQVVDYQQGKPSRTDFRVIASGDRPHVEFTPHTGRTHQLRIHAAHPKGLNSYIVGDTLYGTASSKERLLLHATVLKFVHPATQQMLHLICPPPFNT